EDALTSAGSAGTDHMGASPMGQLHRDRPDPAGSPMDHDGLPGLEVAVVEQRLPRRQAGLGDRGGFEEIDARRLRRDAASVDGDVLGGPAVAVAVDEPEDLVAHRDAGRSVPGRDDDARTLVGRYDARPLVP